MTRSRQQGYTPRSSPSGDDDDDDDDDVLRNFLYYTYTVLQ